MALKRAPAYETELAAQVLTLADQALRGVVLPSQELNRTLTAVRSGLGATRSTVLDKRARKTLEELHWTTKDFARTGLARPDTLAVSNGQRVLVAARAAVIPESSFLRRTIKRLANEKLKNKVDAALVVVPDDSQSVEGGQKVITDLKKTPPRPTQGDQARGSRECA